MEAMRKREMLKHLVSVLVDERARMMGQPMDLAIPEDIDGLWTLFRVLVNVRPPAPAMPAFLDMQDALLRGIAEEKGIANWQDAEVAPTCERMRLWRGDITALRVDAIVNAANSQMLGCWQPGHHCIDNAIHTFAGVQLRQACARQMAAQGHDERTGQAKITPGFNLPAAHVLHTVGPIVGWQVTPRDQLALASCYRSCLRLAEEQGLRSIAFCCISTGEFHYPNEEAARVAVDVVDEYLQSASHPMEVVFNVFKPVDLAIYHDLLERR